MKKPKLPSIPRINRKLFKLWSEKIRERANHHCEYCGIGKGEIGKNGNVINKLDSHHFISRVKKNSFLKWDLNNGICLCSGCHKFSEDSFHRSPVTTMYWLMKNHPEKMEYLIANFDVKVDLKNRVILAEIEKSLVGNLPINIPLLLEMSKLSEEAENEVETGTLPVTAQLPQPAQPPPYA